MNTHHQKRQVGVWLDHSHAYIIEYHVGRMNRVTITSEFNHDAKQSTLTRSEHIMHNKEQQEQGSYFEKIAKALTPYDTVLLFGPTDAKAELHNSMKDLPAFAHIIFTVKGADKLTEYEQYTFVREFFAAPVAQ